MYKDALKTVKLLGEKDPSKIRHVHQAVDRNLDSLFWALYKRSMRYCQALCDDLADLGLPANALSYLKFLQVLLQFIFLLYYDHVQFTIWPTD